ncbi:cysteine desulfurase family protein [Algibacter lectus]|uniref:cysteine desulfurase n=1 Tax=Algibacter lectus TaxID=221126 RepID=A0A4R8MCC1_9FLAO|nr:cysteine desulfurase family protein [Algibacter lectus]MWW23876.1 aminotransferase class V-fold PLP-dependent enzyme [Algibacter lectus]TDY63439.1 cysteine desulfurase [Algibacter lectus]
MKPVYFDNAATTELRDEVIDVMAQVLKANFGNPSSSHSFGRSSKSLIEKSRKAIASCLNVSASEIIFTSGGTEADNLILNSAVRDLGVKHIITTKIEHHAVLHTVEALQESHNIDVSFVNLDSKGNLDFNHLESLLQTETKTLVSLMHINNEIGNITDIKHVSNLCKANNALFHSDAVQSVGHYNLDLQDIQVDFIAAAGHKFHGPKGVGFAFIRKNIGYLKPLIFGGEQERGLRAGTESVHNIAGLEAALKLCHERAEEEHEYINGLKLYFINEIKAALPGVTFNGESENLEKSTYTLINVCLPIPANKSAMLLFQLDLKGIACSKGSACQSGSNKKSHVLSEILSGDDLEKPSLRFSFSIFNTKAEVDYVISILKEFA